MSVNVVYGRLNFILIISSSLLLYEGASIKYVHAKGEGGVGPNAYVVYRLSKRGCVNFRTRGGGASKTPENLRTYLMEDP